MLRVWNLGLWGNFTLCWPSLIIPMSYEPIYERYEVTGLDGNRLAVEFVRSGFLAQGDRPELFFFRVSGEEAVVGISGASLKRFEIGRRCLTRDQKIDVAGRWLKRKIEAGAPLDSRSLYIQDDELANLANGLDFTE